MAGRPGTNKGGGKGDGKGGGTPGKRRTRQTQRSARFNQTAANNVALQDQSQADMLGTLNQQSQSDLLRQRNAAESVYGGGMDALKGVTPTDYEGIRGQMNNALTSLAPDFGGQAYQAPGEAQAGNSLGLAYGEAGNSMLSNMAAREGAHQASSERQMGLQGMYAQDRVNQDLDDSLQQYRNQLQNLRANDPYQIQQEATRLEDQAMSNRLGMSQVKSDAAFSKYLQDMLGNQLSGGNGGGGGGPGGGNHRPGHNPTGPGGGTGGFGLGDTAAGGNQNTGQGTQNTQTGSNSIPAAWWGADTWQQLPEVVKNVYARDSGSARDAFQQSNHPSFQNFDQFDAAYDSFRKIINRLYNEGPGTRYGDANGGIPGRL